jgi:hypothetical protein
MQLPDAIAVQHDLVARLERGILGCLDCARKVDATDMRPGLDQPTARREHEAVLVVQRRIVDRHDDVAGRQLVFGHGFNGAADLSVGTLGQDKRTESHGSSQSI